MVGRETVLLFMIRKSIEKGMMKFEHVDANKTGSLM